MPAWLVPIAGKLAGGILFLLAGFLSVWWFKRSIEKRKDAEAKAADSKLRAEATKASLEGYVAEKTHLEGVDPVTGKPRPSDRL